MKYVTVSNLGERSVVLAIEPIPTDDAPPNGVQDEVFIQPRARCVRLPHGWRVTEQARRSNPCIVISEMEVN